MSSTERPTTRQRRPRTTRWCAPLLLALVCGCGGDAGDAAGDAHDPESFDVRNPALPAGAANLPFDPRVATLLPDDFVGTEQFCDVVYVGTLRELERELRQQYGGYMTEARHVQCAGSTGRGWMDVFYRKDRSDLRSETQIGMRIRVNMLAPEGGFEGYPIGEMLGVVGEIPEDAPRPPPPRQPQVGDPFDDVEQGSRVMACGVSYAGQVQRLQSGAVAPRWVPENLRDAADDAAAAAAAAAATEDPTSVQYRARRTPAPYPGNASHRLPVVCRHERGESWLDVVFTRETFPSALDAVRGRLMAVRIHRANAGDAGRPIAIFLPLGAAAPRPPEPEPAPPVIPEGEEDALGEEALEQGDEQAAPEPAGTE